MKRTKKLTVIASAVATTALCASLAAGATFALFTSEDSVDITVSTGNVNVTAAVQNVEHKRPETITETETGYSSTGFTAVNSNEVSVQDLLPGDMIEFDLVLTNAGSVPANYQYVVKGKTDDKLFDTFEVTIAEGETQIFDGSSLLSYTSAWVKGFAAASTATYHLTFELPAELGNEYADIQDSSICVNVYAVQGNAAVSDDPALVEYTVKTAEALQAKLEAPDVTDITLAADLALTESVTLTTDKNIDLAGKTLDINGSLTVEAPAARAVAPTVAISGGTLNMSGQSVGVSVDDAKLTLDNVTVEHVGPTKNNGTFIDIIGTSEVTITGSTLSFSHDSYGIAMPIDKLDDNTVKYNKSRLTIDKCDITNNAYDVSGTVSNNGTVGNESVINISDTVFNAVDCTAKKTASIYGLYFPDSKGVNTVTDCDFLGAFTTIATICGGTTTISGGTCEITGSWQAQMYDAINCGDVYIGWYKDKNGNRTSGQASCFEAFTVMNNRGGSGSYLLESVTIKDVTVKIPTRTYDAPKASYNQYKLAAGGMGIVYINYAQTADMIATSMKDVKLTVENCTFLQNGVEVEKLQMKDGNGTTTELDPVAYVNAPDKGVNPSGNGAKFIPNEAA